jgi:hypothetical protein
MADEYRLSIHSLIKDELDGKASAIARYDDMIWKIRTGYAVLLYGVVGIVAGLLNQKTIAVTSTTSLAIPMLIVGFSVFGAMLDYSFMSAKLRVVKYRDQLVAVAHSIAVTGLATEIQRAQLVDCLKNSGERKERDIWVGRAGRLVPLIYYGGTAAICTSAIFVLMQPVSHVPFSPS